MAAESRMRDAVVSRNEAYIDCINSIDILLRRRAKGNIEGNTHSDMV